MFWLSGIQVECGIKIQNVWRTIVTPIPSFIEGVRGLIIGKAICDLSELKTQNTTKFCLTGFE